MNYDNLIAAISGTDLARLEPLLPVSFEEEYNHGDMPGWLRALSRLPDLTPLSVDLQSRVRIGEATQCDEEDRANLSEQLLALQPWRKGPFELFGLPIDTEWRSDWKWDRLINHIKPLAGCRVLDIGCGNGYHCWRMAGEGARLVIGADPHLLFVMQYWAIRRYLKEPPVYVIPLALEELPKRLKAFDVVFSMGVLYHQRSPMDHLLDLKDCLKTKGELILETLVIDGELGMTLIPQGRYARMPNVWFLPTCLTMENWLEKCGFKNIRLVDVSVTSIAEQRTTPWMLFESLPEALDSRDPSRTIEGYPAPKRAIFVAEKP